MGQMEDRSKDFNNSRGFSRQGFNSRGLISKDNGTLRHKDSRDLSNLEINSRDFHNLEINSRDFHNLEINSRDSPNLEASNNKVGR
jgi:hypothetical protein